MSPNKRLLIGFAGAVSGLFVLALASFVSGVATSDAREFMNGYRDWEAIYPAFYVPTFAALLAMITAVVASFMRRSVARIVYILCMALVSGLGMGELGMNVTNVLAGPGNLITFYLVYQVFAVSALLMIQYRRRIGDLLTKIAPWPKLLTRGSY